MVSSHCDDKIPFAESLETDGVGLEAHIWLGHRVHLKIWNI